MRELGCIERAELVECSVSFFFINMSTKSLVKQLAILGLAFGLAVYGGFRYYRTFSKVGGFVNIKGDVGSRLALSDGGETERESN